MVGKSLRLQALMNTFVGRHLTRECCKEEAHLTACCLFTLTVKSVTSGGLFPPTNARDLVFRHHRRIMARLREAAAAAGADVADIVEEARKLKELSAALREYAAVQLKTVRSPRVARQMCTMFRLGEQAFREWEQRIPRGGSSPGSSGSKGKLHASPSPPKRGKRKSPDRPELGHTRFGPVCCVEAAPPGSLAAAAEAQTAGGEPLRRRRTSEDSEPPGLAPKQLFGSGSADAMKVAAAEAVPSSPQCRQQQPCAEWQQFKAFVASPLRAPGSSRDAIPEHSQAGTVSAPHGALDTAVLSLTCSTQTGMPTSIGWQALSSATPADAGEQGGKERHPMEVDSTSVLAVAAVSQEVFPPFWLGGQLPPPAASPELGPASSSRGIALAAPPVPPPELLPIPALLPGHMPPPPAPSKLTPDHLPPWGLLLSSSASQENSSQSSVGTSGDSSSPFTAAPHSIVSSVRSSRASPAASCRAHNTGGRAPLLLQSPTMELAAAVRDIMVLLRCGCIEMQMLSECDHQLLDCGIPWEGCGAHSNSRTMTCEPARHAAMPQGRQLEWEQRVPPAKLVIHAGAFGALLADRRAIRQQAAHRQAKAGGQLDAVASFGALNGCGRAHSILRPLQLPAVPTSA